MEICEQKHGRHMPYSYFGGKHTKEGISAKTQRWKKPQCSRKICAASEAGAEGQQGQMLSGLGGHFKAFAFYSD